MLADKQMHGAMVDDMVNNFLARSVILVRAILALPMKGLGIFKIIMVAVFLIVTPLVQVSLSDRAGIGVRTPPINACNSLRRRGETHLR